MHPPASPTRRAFTLIELLVVVAIIALLIAILLPSLARAREQTKSVKCLSNLGQWGKATMTYVAENRDSLPGGVHPAIYRWQGVDSLVNNPIQPMTAAQAQRLQRKYLSTKLRRQFNDSDGSRGSVTDQISTCPTLAGIVPDSHWVAYSKNPAGQKAFPTHYSINNFGSLTVDGGGSGSADQPRTTDPSYYFGYYDPSDNEANNAKFPPKQISKVKRPADEWAIADAWYRPSLAMALSTFYQQEGPYQSGWTGNAMPHFAPHFSKRSSYSFSDPGSRNNEASVVRDGRQDGRTNALFFDGHCESVVSKRCLIADFELLYGFQGTVNPVDPKVPEGDPEGQIPYWQ